MPGPIEAGRRPSIRLASAASDAPADGTSLRDAPDEISLRDAPDEASLRDAGMAHLARYETTRAGLARVLSRRIARWAKRAAASGAGQAEIDAAAARAQAALARVVDRLAASGAVDDARYAARREAQDIRAGRSMRMTRAALASRGVDGRDVERAPEDELAAAIVLLRRRRLGPFGDDDARALAALARRGFDAATARAALRLTRDEAEALLAARR